MLFSGRTLLSVCQVDSSCKIEVKCLGDEHSCNYTGQLGMIQAFTQDHSSCKKQVREEHQVLTNHFPLY